MTARTSDPRISVDDPAIEDGLSRDLDISEQVVNLIDLAKSAGGDDNITVALCKVTLSS